MKNILSVYIFLDCSYSPGAAIDWYYQYQSMYLRLVAANQMKETLDGTNIDQSSSCQLDDCVNINNHHQQHQQNNSIDPCTNESGQSTSVNNFLNIGSRDLMNNYSCPKCGNGYTRLHSLNRHIRFECGVEPQFECPMCHKKSKHKHNLMLHMRTHQKS